MQDADLGAVCNWRMTATWTLPIFGHQWCAQHTAVQKQRSSFQLGRAACLVPRSEPVEAIDCSRIY